MNITKLIFAILITAVITSLNSCTDSNASSSNNINLQRQNDSLVKANKDLAYLVTVPVEDSSMLQYVKIPENVKTAWWEYQQAKYAIDREFDKAEETEAAAKKLKIDKAAQEQKSKTDQANAVYQKIEDAAQKDFAKNSKEFLALIANPDNIYNFYLYLGSDDRFWSLTADFNFKQKGNEKMPDDFKKMLILCQSADSIKKQTERYENRIFETKKSNAEEEYDNAMAIARKIAAEKISSAYMLYLQKIK